MVSNRPLFFWLLGLLLLSGAAAAQEFTSSDFKVLDPVLFPAGFSTSTDYQLWGSMSQPGVGTSTASSFGVRAGFLYFPTPSSPAVTTESALTGGQSSSGGSLQTAAVELSGLAYPNQPVTVLADGVLVARVSADNLGQFAARLERIGVGTKIFAVYSEDADGQQSQLLTFPVVLRAGAVSRVTGIFLPPTISSDKETVAGGEILEFFGQSSPRALMELVVTGASRSFVVRAAANDLGRFRYQLAVDNLPLGQYRTLARATSADNRLISQFSRPLAWAIGSKTVPRALKPRCPRPGDLNGDCRVDLSDFSILVYWFDRPNPPAAVDLEPDGRISLRDFSVAAYHWTG